MVKPRIHNVRNFREKDREKLGHRWLRIDEEIRSLDISSFLPHSKRGSLNLSFVQLFIKKWRGLEKSHKKMWTSKEHPKWNENENSIGLTGIFICNIFIMHFGEIFLLFFCTCIFPPDQEHFFYLLLFLCFDISTVYFAIPKNLNF